MFLSLRAVPSHRYTKWPSGSLPICVVCMYTGMHHRVRHCPLVVGRVAAALFSFGFLVRFVGSMWFSLARPAAVLGWIRPCVELGLLHARLRCEIMNCHGCMLWSVQLQGRVMLQSCKWNLWTFRPHRRRKRQESAGYMIVSGGESDKNQ